MKSQVASLTTEPTSPRPSTCENSPFQTCPAVETQATTIGGACRGRCLSSRFTHSRPGKQRTLPRSWSCPLKVSGCPPPPDRSWRITSENATEGTVLDVFAQTALKTASPKGTCPMRITRVTSCGAEEGAQAQPLRRQCKITGRKSLDPCGFREKDRLACGRRGSERTPGCRVVGAPVGGRCSSVTKAEEPPSHRDDLPIHCVIETHRRFVPTTLKQSVDL